MSISFSGSELINTAIGIERRGAAFYDTMARTSRSGDEQQVFKYLANMERRHIHIFQEMLAEADSFSPPEGQAEEYAAYLEALTESAVFTDDLVTSEMVSRTDSDIGALELAIDAEKDSLLFYYEMRDITPKRSRQIVNQIIAEEKSHLRQLSDLKKKLGAAEAGE